MDPHTLQAPSAYEPPAPPATAEPPRYGARLEQRLATWTPAQRESLTTHVQRVVAEAPPLTESQRELIGGLLRPTTALKEADAA